jgi:hypothetical protein
VDLKALRHELARALATVRIAPALNRPDEQLHAIDQFATAVTRMMSEIDDFVDTGIAGSAGILFFASGPEGDPFVPKRPKPKSKSDTASDQASETADTKSKNSR